MFENAEYVGQYRVWIVECDDWKPSHWGEVPPQAVPIEPADPWPMSAEAAAAFVQGFNQRMLRLGVGQWAVRCPVTVHFDGDLSVGLPARGLMPIEECKMAPVAG